MPTQEDIANQQELLATYRRRLARHLKQLAQLGETHAPPDIFESIREARVHIQRIKGNLRIWVIPFEDHPDDESVGSTLPLLKMLSSEIRFNLVKIKTFIEQGYRVVGDTICSKDDTDVMLNYFSCVTSVFDSGDTQKVLAILEDEMRDGILQIYVGFKDINDKAEALKYAFRPWRASSYIDAIDNFEERLRSLAEKLTKDLLVII